MITRVLVVDDEPIAAQATALMVKQGGKHLDVIGICHSGREAISDSTQLKPDLVIMDIQMPGINGLEAMRRIKKESPSTCFIILSAYSEFGYAVEALRLGASSYLLKPVKQSDLNASIQKSVNDLYIKNSELDRDLRQREQLEIALPMIKKDFILSLLPGSEADEKLVACASFLFLRDRAAFIVVLSMTGDESDRTVQTVFGSLFFNVPDIIFEKVSCSMTAVYVPIPENADPDAFMAEIARQIGTLIQQQRSMGRSIFASCGKTASNIVGLKLSMQEAISALSYAKSNIAVSCAIFDESRMAVDLQAQPEGKAFYGPNQAERIIARAVKFMTDNHSRDLTLDEVASHINLSPFYFSRFFKETTGRNFIDTLLTIRIDHAKKLLSQTNASIKEIASLVGFNDPNYFSRVFHKSVGIKASDYRNRRCIVQNTNTD